MTSIRVIRALDLFRTAEKSLPGSLSKAVVIRIVVCTGRFAVISINSWELILLKLSSYWQHSFRRSFRDGFALFKVKLAALYSYKSRTK
jgi:hypothetical protein